MSGQPYFVAAKHPASLLRTLQIYYLLFKSHYFLISTTSKLETPDCEISKRIKVLTL